MIPQVDCLYEILSVKGENSQILQSVSVYWQWGALFSTSKQLYTDLKTLMIPQTLLHVGAEDYMFEIRSHS